MRFVISSELEKHIERIEAWKESVIKAELEVENTAHEGSAKDWYRRQLTAKKKLDQIKAARPESPTHDLMYTLAKFLYTETIARTDSCMTLFDQNEIDTFLKTSIEFDEFTVNYLFDLVHSIGGSNVLQTDYADGKFDITVGTEIVAIYHLNENKDDYVRKIIERLEEKYDYERSDALLIEWSELEEIFSGLEVYSIDEDESEEEFDKCTEYFTTSDFTKALVKILDNSFAFSKIDEQGLIVDLSGYYA